MNSAQKKNFSAQIDAQKEEMIRTLQELLTFPSVVADPEDDAPFGREVQRAYDYMMQKARADGFETENVDNYGGHIEFGGLITGNSGEILGTSGKTMGILCHLDVVPAGNDWRFDPWGGEISDGRIYGRGATDDKGPTVAVYYAMKALKDTGVLPRKKVRLILGLDEETEWKGMARYLARVKAPDFGFTPDAEFPAINGEMGILVFDLAKKIRKEKTQAAGLALRSLSGGNAPNMVADSARAVVRAESYQEIRKLAAEFQEETGFSLRVKGVGRSLEIIARGKSAHGARPQQGLNAISVLLAFLSRLPFTNESVLEFLDFYQKHIGFELHGDGMGCGFSDEPSGKLVFNVGTVSGDDEAVMVTINIRYPVTMDQEQIYEAMMPVINQYDMGVIKGRHQAPIYLPPDDPLIRTLMAVYRQHTGDRESRPQVIGGGTYARAAKNIVAFGAAFPGEPELAHQKDEWISIENLVKMTKIFADAIYELTCRPEADG